MQCTAGQVASVTLSGVSEFYCGFFYRIANYAADMTVLSWWNGANELGALAIDSNHKLKIIQGTSTVLATGNSVLSNNTIYHIQIHFVLNDATGVFDVKLDNNTEITFAGDTKPGADTTVVSWVFSVLTAGTNDYDSFVLNDTTGTEANSWPGVVRFKRKQVSGPGNYVNNWSRNTGSTNWEAVDEIPNDSDTTYLSTTTSSTYESFSSTAHGLTNATVLALITTSITKKDSGTPKLIVGIRDKDNSTDYMTPAINLGTSYGIVQERRPLDPSTGAAFTLAGADNQEPLIVSSD